MRKNTKSLLMTQKLSQDISQKSARISFFIFFSLLSLSVTFFVFASDDVVTEKNIFQDSDQDGLSNDEEVLYKTDPLNKDTDGDGYMDGVEVESGYDPTKPAPGDKIISGEDMRGNMDDPIASGEVTLTDQVTSEIVSIIEEQSLGEGEELSMDNVSDAIQNIMSQTDQEVVLPEVDLETIKVKEVSSKLKGDKRTEQEREDTIEYLTVMAYILANNSPKKFRTENDLSSILTSFGEQSVTAMILGGGGFIDDLGKTGQKILDETNDIEVPENMLGIHAQALKMAKYAIQLKDTVKSGNVDDPLGKIASLSKVQGFLGVTMDFSTEIYQKLSELGIRDIPLSL